MSTPSSSPGAVDRCPGLLRPHLAADGAVVRVRLPGGRISAAALAGLAAAADAFADGDVQLTSRANLQLRGVPVDAAGDVPDALVDAVRAAGLLPSDTTELVRNILCSPLTGRLGGVADLRPLAERLDSLICDTPTLAALSGRFLFGLDDGRGDIAAAGCDVGVLALSPSTGVLLAGGHRGPVVDLDDAARLLIRLATAFLALQRQSGAHWHVAELPAGGVGLLAVAFDSPIDAPSIPGHQGSAAAPFYGACGQVDGRSLLSLVVPLGRLTQAQVRAVVAAAALGSGELIVTPWHGLVVPDLPIASDPTELAGIVSSLAAAGLPSTTDSGWIGVTACTGAPGCARAAGATVPVAARIAAAHDGPVHVVACERRCGAPTTAHREVMIELTGPRSRHRPALAARTDDGRARRRHTGPTTAMSTAAPEKV